MRSSNSIWLPSKQQYVRVYDITGREERILARVTSSEDDINLCHHLTEMLKELVVEEISVDDINILDRFVLLLQMRIISFGESVVLTRECPKCKKTKETPMSLNKLIEDVKGVVDRQSHDVAIQHPTSKTNLIFSPPTTKKYMEYLTYRRDVPHDDSGIENFYHAVGAHLKKINLPNNTEIDLSGISYTETMQIIERFPRMIYDAVTYGIKQYNAHYKTPILEFVCKNDECSMKNLYYFDMYSLDHLLQMIYGGSVEKFVDSFIILGKKIGMSSETILDLLPWERDHLTKRISDELKSNEKESDNAPMLGEDDI